MILEALVAGSEKCTSPDYHSCPVYERNGVPEAPFATCPFLEKPAVQYCAASSTPRYVPWSEHSFSRCGGSGHRYCELYLGLTGAGHPEAEDYVDELYFPRQLWYTKNHMWLDRSEDGHWHAGIDALMAQAVGRPERIVFISTGGYQCPTAVITTANRMELPVLFPFRLRITGANLHLRADPGRLIESPYAFGWLFEGEGGTETSRLIPGSRRQWFSDEINRLHQFAHANAGAAGAPADGGGFAPGAIAQIGRESGWQLYNDFFSPCAGGQL
jgi:glycine cleavage system H lipoate-binding protein